MSSVTKETVNLNLLLIGKTGHGKSETGNTLINTDDFETSSNCESQTKDVKFKYSIVGNYILKVVDGPGLDDTTMTRAEDRKTFARCMTSAIAMCSEGVDAFIFVIRFPFRYTEEVQSVFESVKKVFGDRFMSHVIVVVTFGDIFCAEFEDNPISFKDWCERQKGEIHDLYIECNERFLLFNNWETDQNTKMAQVKQVVDLVHSLQKKSGRYTSKCFEDAKEQRERHILKLNAPHLRVEYQKTIGLLTATIVKFCRNPEDGDKENIKTRIDDLKRTIESENKHYGILDDVLDLVKKVEENLNDVETLHSLTRQLEIIRQAKDLWATIGSACTVVSGIVLSAFPPIGIAAGATSGAVTGIGYAALRVAEHEINEKLNSVEKKINKK